MHTRSRSTAYVLLGFNERWQDTGPGNCRIFLRVVRIDALDRCVLLAEIAHIVIGTIANVSFLIGEDWS